MIQYKYENISGYEVCVMLPSLYDQSKKYRTIYMQDGGGTAHQTINYIDHLIITGQIEPLIIIGIEPIERNHDYTPWEAPAFSSHTPAFGGQANAYLHTLAHEIKPYIDAHYATNAAPSHTAIAGCSFGALVSIYASYHYGDVFHQYISLSASFWYEDFLRYMKGEEVIRNGISYTRPAANRSHHRLYLYVGQLEGIYKQTIQKNMVEYTIAAHQQFEKEGFPSHQLLFETDREGTHDELFFTKYFISSLHWLYGLRNQ